MKLLALPLLAVLPLAAANEVLIVADEFPAMQVLAKKLETGAQARCTIVAQDRIPAGTTGYAALIVYIHKGIGEPAERSLIDYAQAGGKLILLHHSISSGKRKNHFWLPTFLEMSLPEKEFSAGGYKYYEGIRMEVVNLAPDHPVTTTKVKYPAGTDYKSVRRPAFELDDTEVYLNHVFAGERTTLLGIKFHDAKTGILFQQDTGGWWKRSGRGTVFYFMPGHSVKEFEDPAYAQILVNAVNFKP
ncbi:MAG: ThuA domain-containing protein [Acidobacteria bacterium]|nr:ThuA domain-containing protein [Acidobacteriota bacterium]